MQSIEAMIRREPLIKMSNKQLNELYGHIWHELIYRSTGSKPESCDDTMRALYLKDVHDDRLIELYGDTWNEVQRRAAIALEYFNEALDSAEEQIHG